MKSDSGGIRLLSPKQVRELTSLSERQQDRLEAFGKFPRSVKLGAGRNARKGRVETEIIAWMAARIAERDGEAA